jgi:GNAT superfamily N-acetyltransferase
VGGHLPLFRTGETAETERVVLSAARSPDIQEMPWLAAALAPEWEIADLLAHVEADEGVAIAKPSGGLIGVAVVTPDEPEAGVACMAFVAIDPRERFRGLGGEAGLAVERRVMERWGARRVLASVPEGRGLAVYFWLRLGYRPLTQPDAPWVVRGLGGKAVPGIWMERDGSGRLR